MRAIGVIFILALIAIAISVYTDEIFTSTQVKDSHSERTMMRGESHDPIGF
jgi:hypothetical protein